MDQKEYKVVIVGGGTAGISVASRLVRASKALKDQTVIIDPAKKHYYQPLWTLVGGGAAKKEDSVRSMESLIPKGVDWIQNAVAEVRPEENRVVTDDGRQIKYDYLVMGAGLQINWKGIKGLEESLGKNGVCSNYSAEHVEYTWEAIRKFKGGNAIFTHPSTPIKCGGAPQKIMYLADDYFRKSGVRDKSEIIFRHAGGAIFAVEKYANALNKVIDRKNIKVNYLKNLVEILPDQKEAVFEHMETKETEVLKYDMIHVTPPMESPDFIKNSSLADKSGWVDVDQYTLQHKRYSNVFGIGDCSNLPTSKTGAAIRKQAPVVEKNLLMLMQEKELEAKYNGYTSCPLVTGYNRLIMAEFDYNLEPQESFPVDQGIERRSMYLVKKELLPLIYWNGMLKGVM
ncbi:FAD/NAD(P)-binding oxidoreductase [Alteribacillus sp. YIM 98480]|uniref:NAD(P)/FAD-dependent oxidoreductase n=1 Tax=Alteribacillus sp. YIM 98480 TaxID=2606599 RepID=UPI00131E515D|nr:FAD/NAD(P)-binding oxidoreductase [Alteribacillus sp. YIM 98480]